MSAGALDAALVRLSAAVDRLEHQAVRLLEELVGRRLADRDDDPAILRDPRVRGAGIRLEDVRLDPGPVDGGPASPPLTPDPQAVFAALAEQVGSYRLAAQQHPEVAEAARTAAYLNREF